MIYAVRYYWRTAKGYRLRPWQSPYLRWRLETFFGVKADSLTRQEFLRLLGQNRRRIREFLHWAAELEHNYF